MTVTQGTFAIEAWEQRLTWEERAKRLALELKAAKYDPFTSNPEQREDYAHLRYAMQCHLEAVEDE
jgi:hypothetical protein